MSWFLKIKKPKRDGYIANATRREADGCAVCGISVKAVLHAHHIQPLDYGGADDFSNVIAVCQNCHRLIHYVRERKVTKESPWIARLTHLTDERIDRLLDLAHAKGFNWHSAGYLARPKDFHPRRAR